MAVKLTSSMMSPANNRGCVPGWPGRRQGLIMVACSWTTISIRTPGRGLLPGSASPDHRPAEGEGLGGSGPVQFGEELVEARVVAVLNGAHAVASHQVVTDRWCAAQPRRLPPSPGGGRNPARSATSWAPGLGPAA